MGVTTAAMGNSSAIQAVESANVKVQVCRPPKQAAAAGRARILQGLFERTADDVAAAVFLRTQEICAQYAEA